MTLLSSTSSPKSGRRSTRRRPRREKRLPRATARLACPRLPSVRKRPRPSLGRPPSLSILRSRPRLSPRFWRLLPPRPLSLTRTASSSPLANPPRKSSPLRMPQPPTSTASWRTWPMSLVTRKRRRSTRRSTRAARWPWPPRRGFRYPGWKT